VSKLCVLLPCLLFSSFSAFAENEISRVSLQFYNSEQLTRIPEYFTGKEYVGNRIYCRSSEEKEGLYFSFTINKKFRDLPPKTNIFLSIIRFGGAELQQFKFTLPMIDNGKREILLGLTGKDWVRKENKPIAWQIEFKNSKDELLFFKKSFLWDHD
tara:strand:- start:246 stop:713 length:468 start_codon:yes stop_codon:yes gene_type:complete